MGDHARARSRGAREKLEAHYGDADDHFVGVYVAEVELEANIDDGLVNAIGTPLMQSHHQQSLF